MPGAHFHSKTCLPRSLAMVIAAPPERRGVSVTVWPSMVASPTFCAVTVTTPSLLVATEATYFDVAVELSQPQPPAAMAAPELAD